MRIEDQFHRDHTRGGIRIMRVLLVSAFVLTDYGGCSILHQTNSLGKIGKT